MTTSIRPLNAGELLDRTFFLYRKHFALFVGIVAVPNLVLLAAQILGISLRIGARGGVLISILWSLAIAILYLAVMATSQAGTIIGVSRVHLELPTSLAQVFSSVRGRIVEISLLTIGMGIGIGMGFVLFVIPGIVLTLMWALTVPVAVLEEKGLRDSVSRSAELTKGQRGRIFVIYVLFFVLTYTVYMLWEMPILMVIGAFSKGAHVVVPAWTQLAFALGSFLSQSLVSPLLTIALSLAYYDARVRKEAFDLQLMMSNLDGEQEGIATATTV